MRSSLSFGVLNRNKAQTASSTIAVVAALLMSAVLLSFSVLMPVIPKAVAADLPVKTDFNGDGYADLAIGVVGEDVNGKADAGLVNVLYGSATGLSATFVADQRFSQDYSVAGDSSSNIRDVSEADDHFGAALASGDFNKDGFADLAIGVPGEDVGGSIADAGAINIIYGSASGLSPNSPIANQFWTQDSADVEDNAEAGDRFGVSLAAGDFNKDGFADLAIGVPNESINGHAGAGSVNILYGSLSGLSATSTVADQRFFQDSPGVADFSEDDDSYGASVASGDFNKDGFADLAAGVPGEDLGGVMNTGAVGVIYGSPSGLSALYHIADQLWSQDSAGVGGAAVENEFFGSAMAVGDFNKDSYFDLAIGAPSDSDSFDRGAINFLYGSAAGLAGTSVTVTGDNFQLSGQCPASLGTTLSSGDYDADGFWDLAIGDPNSSSCASSATPGELFVIYFGMTGVSPDTQYMQGLGKMTGTGQALASGDYDADGFSDLAVGSPTFSLATDPTCGPGCEPGPHTGHIGVIFGSTTGLTLAFPAFDPALLTLDQSWTQNNPSVEDVAEDGDRFGSSLT